MISKKVSYALKCFGMISVLISHLYGSFHNEELITQIAVIWFCRIGMSIFMLLSGYGVAMSFQSKAFNGYWDSKVRRIYIPAVLANIFVLIIKIGLGVEYSRASAIQGLFMCTENNTVNEPLWYIPFLFANYFIFYVMWLFFKDVRVRRGGLLLAITLFWFVVPSVLPGGFFFTFSFPAGVFRAEYEKRFRLAHPPIHLYQIRCISLCVFLIGFTCLTYTNGRLVPQDRMNGLLVNLIILVCTLGLVSFFRSCEDTMLLSGMERVGKISFEVYLLHYVICITPIYQGIADVRWIFPAVPLTFGLAYLMNCCCKRMRLT